MGTRLACGWLLLAACSARLAAQPQSVVINEALFHVDPESSEASRNHPWIEIHNKGAEAVDLNGWKVKRRDGESRSLPPVSLPAGGYLVIHFATGSDGLDFAGGSGDYYTGDDPAAPYWSAAQDEAALYSSDQLVDFLAWRESAASYEPGAAHAEAVSAGLWPESAAVAWDNIQSGPNDRRRFTRIGESLGRSASSADSNSPVDFFPHGGVNALGPSPGRQNLDYADFISAADLPAPEAIAPAAAKRRSASQARWTILIYADGDNDLEKEIYRNIKEIEGEVGTSDEVNFVVQFDGQQYSRRVTVDSEGKLTSISALGGTMRGRIPREAHDKYIVLDSPPGESPDLGELNMGDPQTLKDFVAWGTTRYPAEKYGLILSSHGAGWKRVIKDESSPGSRENFDALYMGELAAALEGSQFELMVFDACLMAMIEVAWQVQPYTKWLVASEETIPGDGVGYRTWVPALLKNPGWDGRELGRQIVSAYSNYYLTRARPLHPYFGTLSLINERKIADLVQAVDTFAKSLRAGAGLFLRPGERSDNVQLHILGSANLATRFESPDYMDLWQFALNVKVNSGIPECAKAGVDAVLKAFEDGVVEAETHSLSFHVPAPYGLSIYMPRYRAPYTKVTRICAAGTPARFCEVDIEQSYDKPRSRLLNGDSLIAIYARNNDQLPLQARDMEDENRALDARTQWPSIPSPNLRFVNSTAWSRFLERFYHPVADNDIIRGVAPNGDRIEPVTTSAGACINSWDSITVPAGSTVTLAGAGSSDADISPFGSPFTPFTYSPDWFFWDLDANKPCVGTACLGKPPLAPHEIPYPQKPPEEATTNMDADRELSATAWDQKDEVGSTVQFVCKTSGQFVTTLTVWDDNHTFQFHNNQPAPPYIHPQSSSHQSIIECEPPATDLLIGETPPNVTVGDTVTTQVTAASGFIAMTGYPVFLSRIAGAAQVRSGSAVLPASGETQFNTDRARSTLPLSITPTAAGPVQIRARLGGTSLTRDISFTAVAAPAVRPDRIDLTSSVQSPGSPYVAQITAAVTASGQPVSGTYVTFRGLLGSIRFQTGATFSSASSTQVLTDASGIARANVQLLTGGDSLIRVSALGVSRDITVTRPGTGFPPSLALTLVVQPQAVPLGVVGTIVAQTIHGVTPEPGVQIRFEIVSGSATLPDNAAPGATQQIVTTAGAEGTATFRFIPTSTAALQLRFTIVNSTATLTVAVPVLLN